MQPRAPGTAAGPALREVAPGPVNEYEDIEDAAAGDILDDSDQAMFEAQ